MNDFSKYEGAVIQSIDGLEEGSNEVLIGTTAGILVMFHSQDCCESVWLSQVDGDVQRHVGASILAIKEKITYAGDEDYGEVDEYTESATATFYTLVTTRGYLDFRWQGESNGYYSESVDIAHSDTFDGIEKAKCWWL